MATPKTPRRRATPSLSSRSKTSRRPDPRAERARRRRERYATDPAFAAKAKEASRRYASSAKGRATRQRRIVRDPIRYVAGYLLAGARRRASRKGLAFRLSRQWVERRLRRLRCELTGTPLVLLHGRTPFSPSLDRIDPRRGYTPANVRLTALGANVLRGDVLGDDLLITWARDVVAEADRRAARGRPTTKSTTKRRTRQ